MDLQPMGKVALVTGSTAGIGSAIARSLADKGASVIDSGRTQATVDKAVARIRWETRGDGRWVAGDLSLAEAAHDVVVGIPTPASS